MGRNFRVVYRDPSFKALLHDAGLRTFLQAEMDRVADAAAAQVTTGHTNTSSPPFVAGVDDRGSRLVGYVVTSNIDGLIAEYRHRALTRAFGS